MKFKYALRMKIEMIIALVNAQRYYWEKVDVGIIRPVVNVVQICHLMGVMHRDHKPENFLLLNIDENTMLKAIDFGCSVFIEEVMSKIGDFGFNAKRCDSKLKIAQDSLVWKISTDNRFG